MANGIKRRGSGFLAKEDSFGQGVAANDWFYLPIVDLSDLPIVNYAVNESLAGSSYQANDARPDTQMANLEIEFKLSERIFPLLLLNKYTIASDPVSGDTDVYEHVATYDGRNEGTSLTFLFRELDRPDQEYTGFIVHNLSWVVESPGYIRVRIQGRANFPVDGTDEPSIVATPEFVSRNWLYDQAIGSDSLDGYPLTAFSAEWVYGEPEDTDEIHLGSAGRSTGITTSDMFTLQATSKMPTYDIRNAWRDGDTFASRFGAEDTTRIIAGSVTNINPLIEVNIPASKITDWAPDGDNNAIRRQQFTLTTLDQIGTSGAPHSITILNDIPSY